MKIVILTRKELYALVWSESLPTLTKKYYCTYNELRGICNRMDIPLPKAEYWPNKRLGRSVEIEPLPNPIENQDKVELSLLEEGDEPKSPTKKLVKSQDETSFTTTSTVAKRLTNPDPLILDAQNSINRQESYNHFQGGIKATEKGTLDIRVTSKNIPRALRFMDALVKYFHSRSYEIIFKNEFSYVKIFGEEIRFFIKEVHKRVTVKDGIWDRTELVPTDMLSFRIGESYFEIQFRDGKLSIEEQLPKIIARLEAEAEKEKREREERELYWAKYREGERIKLEIQQKKELEEALFKQLLNDSERWHKSMVLSQYLDAIEVNAITENSMSDELINWLVWARQHMEQYNPLCKKQ